MAEDGPQLRGKQLVFQAMSAIVVAVGVFLLGVMVGRGVPTARPAGTALAPVDPIEMADPSPAVGADDQSGILQEDALGAQDPGYQDLLLDRADGDDTHVKVPPTAAEPFPVEPAVAIVPSKPATRDAASKPAAVELERTSVAAAKKSSGDAREAGNTSRGGTPAAPAKESTTATRKPASSAATASRGEAARTSAPGTKGYVVQVAAYQRQADANGVRDRLSAKGYPAFVTSAATATGTRFRVRVGGYPREADAKAVAARLKREEHLEPWVTR